MTDKKTFAKDILGEETLKKKTHRNQRLIFKVEEFAIEADVKYERLDSKKILPFEEYEQDKEGNRVVKKLVGYNRGEAQYFKAIQDDKGKWVADMDRPIPADSVEKVIMDKRAEGKVNKKDTLKGLWFVKCVPASTITEWLIEDTYNFWAEENSDNLLRVYEYLTANNLVGVYKFNPNGTLTQRQDSARRKE